MIELIMLCGQGSSGKSTYAKQNFSKDCIVSMDAIVGQQKYNPIFKKQYIDLIQGKLNNKEKIIVLDFAHDSINSRRDILSKLNIPENVNFTTISLRPSIRQIILNDEKRKHRRLTQNEIENIEKIYNHFICPTEEEFKEYNFCQINNIVINGGMAESG